MFAKRFRFGRGTSAPAYSPWDAHMDECAQSVQDHLGITLVPAQRQCARALVDGAIVEMQTGEGKTAAAVPAAAWLARAGKKVHILTANDYLARRDAEWMAPVYGALGLRAAWVRQESTPEERRNAYAADVTYVAATEAGFDHLRDCRALSAAERVQQRLDAVIVDEADCVLIDEARIPLVLAGESEGMSALTLRAAAVAGHLQAGIDYEAAPQATSFNLTPAGSAKAERLLGRGNLYSTDAAYLTAILHALQARHLLQRDHDYLVHDGAIIPIDAYKGRGSRERRWPAGLHAALEAKEGVPVREPGRVLASVTMQNFVLMYGHLCGMTGTARSQAEEFERVYSLGVATLAPHRPVVRIDHPDRLFRTLTAKNQAILDEIRSVHATGRPILIGTSSVAESEALSAALPDIPHHVLNAKNEDLEAPIIARAGAPGAVTISTNMAGRGVDIRLGDGVAALGGLHIIGTSRNDSRRIDHQLRGRAGRQGDPGSSQFFLSLEDPLFQRLLDPGETVASQFDCDSLQRRAEGRHLETRTFLDKYENLIEGFRHSVLTERQQILDLNEPGAAAHLDAIDESWACLLEEIEHVKSTMVFHNLDGSNPFQSFLRTADALCQSFWGFVDEELEKRRAAGNQPTRRGATWTYISVDMPFGTLSERLMRGLARKLRSASFWG